MAKFLNTSGINYHLEEIIKGARDRLIIISPYLRLNDRIKELLEDKDRLKIDVRVIYGKAELHPEEIKWLRGLQYVRTSYCSNLHAKCYLSESACIIGSLNLYTFSQINNNEMGVLINRDEDSKLYQDTYEEVQRLIRISDEVRISMEVVSPEMSPQGEPKETESQHGALLTTPKLAQKYGIKTPQANDRLVEAGYLEMRENNFYLTEKGKEVGGIFKKGQYGIFFLWPEDLKI